MTGLLASLHVACLMVVAATSPDPGRLPKVYNALITSSQNLEPSKAYPVYQPVLQDFAFPYQPAFFYNGDLQNFFSQPPVPITQEVNTEPAKEAVSTEASDVDVSTESPIETSEKLEENNPKSEERPSAETARSGTDLPPPPNTQSPIPLNEFGLPPAVIPLGRFDPTYNGFTQISQASPFYNYPSLRFYDPFDPYGLSPFTNFHSFYRSIPNTLTPAVPEAPAPSAAPVLQNSPPPSSSPPAEPSDLNLLNYSSKDPAIPNVPPPPLPHGGLKSEKSE